MVKYLMITLCLFGSFIKAEEVPKPKVWMESIAEKLWLHRSPLPRNIAIVCSDSMRQQKWDSVMAGFSKLAWMKYVDRGSIEYIHKLNAKIDEEEIDEVSLNQRIPVHLLLQDDGSEFIVKIPENDNSKSRTKWTYKESIAKSSEHFLEWLNSQLGYEAFVLDSRGDFILAALIVPNQKLGQGILIKDSSSRLTLKAHELEGGALLQMMEIENSLAVFEILSRRGVGQKILPGTKIILGKNRQINHVMEKLIPVK